MIINLILVSLFIIIIVYYLKYDKNKFYCIEQNNKFIIIMKDLYSNYFCLKTKENTDCFSLKTLEDCKKFSDDFKDNDKKNFLLNNAGVSISLYCKNDDYSDKCNQLRS